MKKKDLTTAWIYLVIGVICFAALVLTDSKLDSLLIAGAAVGLLEGVVKIGNYVYWRRPKNQAEYREMQESEQIEQIEQQDELMQMLRDQAYRHAYITNLRVTMAAALICGALKLIDILAFGDKLMYALAAWVILQLILVDVIYRCLNRKYSD